MQSRKIRVTKEFTFETAHALEGYEGKCKDIHGHSYNLSVTVIGEPISEIEHSKNGMVIDFTDMKAIVKDKVISEFDHKLLLRNDSRFLHLAEQSDAVHIVPYQPTCELMLLEIVEALKSNFPSRVKLVKVLLRETATGYAEWHLSDNSE